MTRDKLVSESLRLINIVIDNGDLMTINPMRFEHMVSPKLVDIFTDELGILIDKVIMDFRSENKPQIDDSALLKALSDKVAESVIEKMKEVNK